MRKFAIAAIVVALLPTAVHAQRKSLTVRTDEQVKSDAAIDKAYQDALKRERGALGAPAKADPWKSVRPAPDASAKR
jgi:hypothetical protein